MANQQRFVVPDPGAAILSFTVPNGATGIWDVVSMTAVITTDATVGTRLFACQARDSQGNVYAKWTAAQTQAASQALTHSWQRNMSIQPPNATGSTGTVHMCMPGIIAQKDDVISIFDLASLSAADRITSCVIVMEPI